MKYVGLNAQIWNNNIKSIFLLILFPLVILVLVWIFFYFISNQQGIYRVYETNNSFIRLIPWISLAVITWFTIAYFSHSRMIRNATGSVPLERMENKRIYNLVENLCIAHGMVMPKINLIEDDSLNAFASGIDSSTYTISLSRGIINQLNDDELEAVIAHELTHIRNRDVRLLIISIVFVGIFAFLTEALFRMIRFSGGGSGKGKKDGGYIILIALALAVVGYLLSTIFRFALSKKREYLADSGSAMMTKNPLALANALEKIALDSRIEAVQRRDVAQLFIDNPGVKKKNLKSSLAGIFSTHPPVERRIELLRQF